MERQEHTELPSVPATHQILFDFLARVYRDRSDKRQGLFAAFGSPVPGRFGDTVDFVLRHLSLQVGITSVANRCVPSTRGASEMLTTNMSAP